MKSVDPEYRVGGPATAGSGWIDETLAYCAEKKAPLDFVSTHEYATMSGYLDEAGNAGTVFSPDRNAITSSVRRVRGQIDRSPFAGTELHYTEWSASYTPADPIHDSYHSAAFILDKMKNIGTAASSMSYWTFTDIVEGPECPIGVGMGLCRRLGSDLQCEFYQLGQCDVLAFAEGVEWLDLGELGSCENGDLRTGGRSAMASNQLPLQTQFLRLLNGGDGPFLLLASRREGAGHPKRHLPGFFDPGGDGDWTGAERHILCLSNAAKKQGLRRRNFRKNRLPEHRSGMLAARK